MAKYVLLFQLSIISLLAVSQVTTEVEIPKFKDEYSLTVEKLEKGDTAINFRKFRESFLESKQFSIAGQKSEEFHKLEKEMYQNMNKSEFEKAITTTKKMLSIDYTNMMVHKVLRQSYKAIGDTANAGKYKAIQFGLLNSILKAGDGRTCATAWPVIQIDEEYFILRMLEAELLSQKIDNDGGMCDKMHVKTDKGERDYYFETTKIFEQYSKMFK